jgi:urease accessory protein
MNAILTAANRQQEGWRAELSLQFSRQGDRTVLSSRSHVGPLVVQRPFYPEGDVCHVYVVHPPGGIVGGDRLRFHAALQPRAHALITTPASTKFYRSADRTAHLDQSLDIQGATLEWLPQETIVFRDAIAITATRVRLDAQSRFIGWDLTCYGRPASDELFASGRVRQQFELWLDDRPMLIDRLRFDGQSAAMRAAWGLAGSPMLGTLLAYPANAAVLEIARAQEGFACTVVDNVLSCRQVGANMDSMKRAFINLWRTLRPCIIGREAVPPRIWST